MGVVGETKERLAVAEDEKAQNKDGLKNQSEIEKVVETVAKVEGIQKLRTEDVWIDVDIGSKERVCGSKKSACMNQNVGSLNHLKNLTTCPFKMRPFKTKFAGCYLCGEPPANHYCRHYLSNPSGCKYGNQCMFSHQVKP